VAAVDAVAAAARHKTDPLQVLAKRLRPLDRLEEADSESGYRIEKLLELSRSTTAGTRSAAGRRK
jgi:hypothetical protein